MVLTAIEAALLPAFGLHGILATTNAVGPVIMVNGPIARAIGMNAKGNALGQGNRANASIGRALQLVIRNVGGGRPGEVDRATLGSPGKLGFCFAEDEVDSPYGTLAEQRGVEPGVDAITVFAGEGPHCIVDQLSRTPESLANPLAHQLRAMHHHKLVLAFDAILVMGPEHARVFAGDGWSKARLRSELMERLQLDGSELVRGAGGIAEGVPPERLRPKMAKFRPDGLWLVHAGGRAGMFSGILGGWTSGPTGSELTTVEIDPWT